MTYLFDTDTLSNAFGPAPRPSLLRRVALIPVENQATSSITIGELAYGAWRRPQRREAVLEWVEALVRAGLEVLPFDLVAARLYGRLRAELEAAGTLIGDADTRIAAIALANDLTLITGNTRHFQRVPGLTVENWLVS